MKPYTVEVEIEVPRKRAVELFADWDNLYFWQTGLQSITPVSGEIGQTDSVTDLKFILNGRPCDLRETVIENDLPDLFIGRYEWPSGSNILVTEFDQISDSQTKMRCECEYTLGSIMMKLMGLLFAGKFRQQNLDFMNNFKAFCEEGADCREQS